jgi:hypothetical protein
VNFSSLRHLQTSLSRIDHLIRRAVAFVENSDQNPGDALRGLVVSWDEIHALVEDDPMAGLWEPGGEFDFSLELDDDEPDLPFLRLVDSFGLDTLDAYILLACLAPELDRRYERLYAFLQDDISVRRITVNLLMSLLGGTLEQRYIVWERVQPRAKLIRHRLITVDPNAEKPSAAGLSHRLGADARVVQHLLGLTDPDERIRAVLGTPPSDAIPALPQDEYDRLCEGLAAAPLVYFKGPPGVGQVNTALALCYAFNAPLTIIDGGKLAKLELTFAEAWRLALREAYLTESAVLVDGWADLLGNDKQPDADLWAALYDYERPVFLCGTDDWEPTHPHRQRRMLRAAFDVPDVPARMETWQTVTAEAGLDIGPDVLGEISNKFRIPRDSIRRAVNTALDIAATTRQPVNRNDLYTGIQAHISLQLGQLADRITPRFTWENLILPPEQMEQLHEITDRARFAYRVQHEWGFMKRIANANGVSALFAGESGTGKTLAVQVIANELGLALYRIDLSAVVSKYIGETEKNLSRIFTEARSSNAILFFDEADAIFGKRSEVKDARDRYANIEVAYLLQQIEDYDGVAIMATNLRQNLDEAFTRRIDFMVDFPFPDGEYREKLWQAHFPPEAPLDPAVNLADIAERYHLAGGNIRNAALASAYLAAADGSIIHLGHIRSAIRREHQKMGRLIYD